MTDDAAEQVSRGLGWKPDLPTFAASIEHVSGMTMRGKFGAAPLPRAFDGLSALSVIRDQFDTSECTGFSKTGVVATRLRSLGFHVGEFAPHWTYAGGRMVARAGRKARLIDDGAYPLMVMMFGQRFGMLAEDEMPFNPQTVNEEPNLDDFQKGSQFRLGHCRRIDLPHLRVEYIQRSLYAGCPVWAGMQVGSEFKRWQSGNKPVGVEFANTGGHMIYFTGYDDSRRAFRMANSWGRSWGENGFAWISYEKVEHESTSDIYEISITDTAMSDEEKAAFAVRLDTIHARAHEKGEYVA